MYDVYEFLSDPGSRVVVPKGMELPAHLVAHEWKLLGTVSKVSPDISKDVVIRGFYKYRSNVPFSEDQILGEPDWRQRD